MYKKSLNGTNPVMGLSTPMVPAPFATEKSSSVKGAVNTISCGLLDMPAKNKASLNPVTIEGSAGAPVPVKSVTVVLSYLDAGLDPSAHTIKSVPAKLYLKNVYLPALVLPESICVQLPVVPPLCTLPPLAASTLPLKYADIKMGSEELASCGTILLFHF